MVASVEKTGMSIVYKIIGIVIAIISLVALMPTIDNKFTDLSGNVSGSVNFADFGAFVDLLPLLFIIGVVVALITLIIKNRS